MDRQTGIGMKDRYLLLIFKIVLLESSEVEIDDLADVKTYFPFFKFFRIKKKGK